MRTAGIDLAAEAARTAVATVAWDAGAAVVEGLALGADDDVVITAVTSAAAAGIDCPLGWPDSFVDLVVAHRDGTFEAPSSSGRDWRRSLTLRATDLQVHSRTGLTPLSVSADRIGHAALRLAAILAALQGRGVRCERDGSGRVVEAYPAAALKLWGLPHRGYKRRVGIEALDRLVTALLASAPWLDLGRFEQLCRTSDDALDAVLCALVARAAAQGATQSPSDVALARREGWIHLPTGPLEQLAAPPMTKGASPPPSGGGKAP